MKDIVESINEKINQLQHQTEITDEYRKGYLDALTELKKLHTDKYIVRLYFGTYVDYEVEAASGKDAIETARELECDVRQMLDNLHECDDPDVAVQKQ